MTFLAAMVLMSAQAAAEPAWAAAPPPKLPAKMYATLDRYRYFTDCVATSQWQTARALFDVPIGSAAEDRILTRLTGGTEGSECTYAMQMRMTTMLMRGGFAESRYRFLTRNEAAMPVPAQSAAVPAGALFKWVEFNKDSPRQALYEFARCLAERETAAVHAVLGERIGSKEERRALHALSRRFGSCLKPGQRLQANSLTLRPWLAEAQFQLYRARKGDGGTA